MYGMCSTSGAVHAVQLGTSHGTVNIFTMMRMDYVEE